MAGGGGGGVAALVLAEGSGPERQCNRPGPPSIMAPRPACHVAPPPCFSMLRLLARAGRPLWAGLALGC